ncbi:MAG: OsmC family protein [Deltaproteobacteria bacterium]|nr:OsmC family protein [Deltaproteobacteria bacterium]
MSQSWTDEITAELHGISKKAPGTIALPTGPVGFAFPPGSDGPSDAVRNSPEHLLGASVAACWLLTWGLVADKFRLDVVSTTAVAKVSVVPDGPGLKLDSVRLEVSITVRGDREALEGKVLKACEVSSRGCIVEKALRPSLRAYDVVPSISWV